MTKNDLIMRENRESKKIVIVFGYLLEPPTILKSAFSKAFIFYKIILFTILMNACNTFLKGDCCNPNNPENWSQEIPNDIDPAVWNVKNGCYICNINHRQIENSKLCNRSFFSGPNLPLCNPFSFL